MTYMMIKISLYKDNQFVIIDPLGKDPNGANA